MSLVPREELNFTFVVEQYFLSLRGRGLMVSAQDIATIGQWERTGVPVWVVCEALRTAFERRAAKKGPAARPPSSISFARRDVEEAIAAWHRSRVGGGDP